MRAKNALFRVLLVFAIHYLPLALSGAVTINNMAPRVDVNGNIIDAHDGTVQKFTIGNSSLYYMHAMQYGLCEEPANLGCDQTPDHCGFLPDHNISIWSSPDLSSGSWEYVGNSISVEDRPPGVVFRPHLVYNPNTKLYVLWWNYDYNGDFLAVATAPSPAGPFTLQNKVVNITKGQSGDFALFVDDDGTGYVVYSWAYVMHIEQLTPDFIYSSGKTGSDFSEYFVEAPVFFKRGDIYYVLFGYCCCYCEQGSGIMVHTATSPLGPYTKVPGDLACVSDQTPIYSMARAEPTPGQGCQYANAATTSITRSQQNYIVQVDTPNGIEYIWTGDRWQQAPDGIKGHDPQYWVPLQFDSNGMIQNVTWVDSFTMDVL